MRFFLQYESLNETGVHVTALLIVSFIGWNMTVNLPHILHHSNVPSHRNIVMHGLMGMINQICVKSIGWTTCIWGVV